MDSIRKLLSTIVMSTSRASKGLLVDPSLKPNVSAEQRQSWLENAQANFVSKSAANKEYYQIILEAVWPEGHGIPGPILSQDDLRAAIDNFRASQGKGPYKDVFRRVRELQGEEGFTSIIKEGVKYQIQSLQIGAKREPRVKLSGKNWRDLKKKFSDSCANCGRKEPEIKLTPDHRVPRSKGGTQDIENWQPLCEPCNVIKSASCQGCALNCYTCSWAFPETYKPILINDSNKELVVREAIKRAKHPSDVVNQILNSYFSK